MAFYEIIDHQGVVVQGGFDSLESAYEYLREFKRLAQVRKEGD